MEEDDIKILLKKMILKFLVIGNEASFDRNNWEGSKW